MLFNCCKCGSIAGSFSQLRFHHIYHKGSFYHYTALLRNQGQIHNSNVTSPFKAARSRFLHTTSCARAPSVLYPDHYQEGSVVLVDVDLDLHTRFKNISKLYNSTLLRGMKHINVYHLASKFKTLREIKDMKDKLETEKVQTAREMAVLVKQSPHNLELKAKLISKGKSIKENLKDVNKHYHTLEEEVMLSGLALPVDLHFSTPERKDEIIEEIGEKPPESRDFFSHIKIGKENGTILFKNVGGESVYLTDSAATLEQKLLTMADTALTEHGYTQVSCPDIVKTIIVEGCGLDITNPKQVYTLKNKSQSEGSGDHINRNLHLTGVSPLSLTAYILRSNISESSLPLRWYASGRHYSPSWNNPKQGLYACPQSTVVELFGVAKSETQADNMYADFQRDITHLYRQVAPQLHIRVVRKGAPSLEHMETGRVEYQVWSPWLQKYLTVGYVAGWSDFIGRRLMALWSPNTDKIIPGNFVHTVHATAMNITALIGAFTEYGQMTQNQGQGH